MKSVLNVVHYPVYGGPHNRILRLAAPLREAGWRTIAVLPVEDGDAADRLRAAGVEVAQIPLGRLRAVRKPLAQLHYLAGYVPDVIRLFRLIRRVRPDVVVIGGLVNAQAAVAAKLAGMPVVWQIVDSRTPPLAARLLMSHVRLLASAVMFNGDALVRLHAGTTALNVPALVYYPPVDTSRFVPSAAARQAIRAELGVPAEAPFVGMVANVNPAKGIEYFIRAAERVYRERPDAWFAVVGPFYETHRDYTARLLHELQESSLPPGRFIFTGARTDVEAIYPAFDVKLITSRPRSEGSTTTAIEAMSCGVPVVAADVGAVREVVDDGVTAILVSRPDPAAIADATLRLLNDDSLREQMGAAGRRRAIVRFDLRRTADVHLQAFEAALRRKRAGRSLTAASAPSHDRQPADTSALKALLVCPECRCGLDWLDDAIQCRGCGRTYPVANGIPVLLARPAQAEHDELDHLHHKQQQAAYFDRRDAEEFEIARPHGATRLYSALLDEKLRRSVSDIRPLLPGATAASVCGGSGMDAEFLARAGARVLLFDLSLGAAGRAQQRALRTGLPILPVVADAEQLPLCDGAVDLAYVHDGLHHLERPAGGLRELARVARRAVSITEPAAAAATALAVRLGLAAEREEAGNRVARLTTAEVTRRLQANGLRIVLAQRYAMYYRHRPGRLSRLLSTRPFFAPTMAAWRAGNRLIGGFGNKLVVVAVRGNDETTRE